MAITLSLPPLSEEDPLFHEKQSLSDARNLRFEFQFPVSTSKEKVLQILDQMVHTARILYLDEVELYFVGDDDLGPFSPRNELESLNSVLSIIDVLLSGAESDELDALQVLQTHTVDRIKSFGAQNTEEMDVKKCDADVEKLLLKWGESYGVKTKLNVAYFEGAGRGAIASECISIGDTALEIPVSLIISEDLVKESDMFDVFKELDDITEETMVLLWSMRERYRSNSKFKIYFESLPKKFNTDFDASDDKGCSPSSKGEIARSTHMVRGTWLCKDIKPDAYCLPSRLLDHLRAVVKGDDTEVDSKDPGHQVIVMPLQTSKENERSALETILSIFSPMMDGLTDLDDFDRERSSWDVKLAMDYKDKQKRIISSVLSSCSAGIRMLDD